MALNQKILDYSDIVLDSAKPKQSIDLDPGVPTSSILMTLSGSLTVTGANGDGALRGDALQRLISNIRIVRDGDPMVRDIPLRDMHQVYLRSIQQAPTETLPTVDSAGTTAFELRTGIPLATGWLARPWDTHWPGFFVRNSLKLEVTFNTSTANGSSDAGTGALLSAGTDAYTWDTAPTLKVYQVTHPRRSRGSQPMFVRYYSQQTVEAFDGARTSLRERIQSGRPFDMVLFRQTYGANDILQNLIEEISLESTREDFLRDTPLALLQQAESDYFPAVNSDTGYLGWLAASGGYLSNRVVPAQHPNLEFIFKTVAPSSGDGIITYTTAELVRSVTE